MFNLSYGYGWQIDKIAGDGRRRRSSRINPLDKYQIFQADLSVKF